MSRRLSVDTPTIIQRPQEYQFIEAKTRTPPPSLRAVPPKSRPAKLSTRPRKKNRGKARLDAPKRPLKNLSASDVSLKDAADFAGAVWKYGSYALALMNTEEKLVYNALYNANVVNGSYQLLFLPQGSAYNQRNGNMVKVTNLRFEYFLVGNPTATQNITRIIILRDLMNTGTLPSIAEVLEDTSATAFSIVSPYLHDIADRYEVLYDVVHTQEDGAGSFLIHKRLGFSINDHVAFQGDLSTYADSWQGHPVMLLITDNATNPPKFVASTQFDFVDN